tara:strand:+ start:188 stop:847 length:660 start_codon:yes stop_codon:yes gene_type:complete
MISVNEVLVDRLNQKGFVKNKDIYQLLLETHGGESPIDITSISMHTSGTRRISLVQAKQYAKSLKLPLIRVLDDYICKYPVVSNVNNSTGIIKPRDKFQNDYLVCNNDIEYIFGTLVILSASKNVAYLYHDNRTLNSHNLNLEEPQRCVFETKDGEILGHLTDIDFDKKEATYILLKPNFKPKKIKYTKCYPIHEVLYLKSIASDISLLEHAFHEPPKY